MEPKSEAQASFDVLAYASAAIKTYRIPLELTYYSANGSKLTRTDYAGVVVESKPELSVALESSTIRSTNTTGSIFLSVVNKGVADAKFLEVEVAPTNGLTILSGAKTYVGALDSDDYQTVEIKAYAETGASELRLPVALRFKDANNRAYEQQSAVVVPLYSQAELEKYGYATPQSLLVTVAAIIVILLAAWWAYKKFFKNNAKRT
jgi:hypothetical protein